MLSGNYNNEAAVHCIMQIISSKKSGLVLLVVTVYKYKM
jgi:hypothetical protein